MAYCTDSELRCFRLLYEVETYLRTVVRWELRGSKPKGWKGILPNDILANAKERIEQEQAIGVIDSYGSGILSYTNLSELKDIITGALWADVFGAKLPPPLDIVKSEFKKLIAVRNKVAHFRPVTARDARVVGRFAEDLRDWTEDYRRIRSYSTILHPSPNERALQRIASLALEEFMERVRESTLDVGVRLMGHHLQVRARGGGTFDHRLTCAMLDANDAPITLCRPSKGGTELDLFVPVELGSSSAKSLLADLSGAASVTGDLLSASEVHELFEVGRRENVLSEAARFPDSFEAPTD